MIVRIHKSGEMNGLNDRSQLLMLRKGYWAYMVSVREKVFRPNLNFRKLRPLNCAKI